MNRARQTPGKLRAAQVVQHTYLAKAAPEINTELFNSYTPAEQRTVNRVIAKLSSTVLEQGLYNSANASKDYYNLTEQGLKLAFAVYGHTAYSVN